MAQVAVTVNGRRYDIGCDDGQEDDVRRLAAEVDRRVGSMVASVGQVGDARLLVMAGLLMAHELEQAADGAPDTSDAVPGKTPGSAAAMDARLERLALRIEAVAQRLAAATPDAAADVTQIIAAATDPP